MKAREQVVALLKTVYDAGDVNAMQIWKGYSAATDQTGWHYQNFGRSEHHYMGKSVADVKEFVGEVAAYRGLQDFSERLYKGIFGEEEV